MIDRSKRFDVPVPYLMQKIDRDTRIKLFESMLNEYAKTYPNTQRILGYLNWNPDKNVDYLFAIQAKNNIGKTFILYDLVSFGSRRSIPGYYYCIMNDLTDKFFLDGFESMVPLEMGQFNEIIQKTINCSFNKSAPNYWKTRENIDRLIEHLTEITIQYKPQIVI